MAMTNNYGLNPDQKKRVKRLYEAGHSPEKIAKATRCTPDLIKTYIDRLKG